LADFKWIITTDADCKVPNKWLLSYSEFITGNNPKMIAAPVAYKCDKSFLQQFQNMDFLSLIGSTIGAFGIKKPFMCNGANLAYQKESFLAVNGFEGNDNIASGDDVFLLEKFIKTDPNSVKYLKTIDALVITKPVLNFKNLLSQRIRWASKTSATKNLFGKFVGLIVILMNLLMIIGFGIIIRNYFINKNSYKLIVFFLCLFILKWIIDFLLIKKTYLFIGLKTGLRSYILSSMLYPFFVVLVVVLSFFKKYNWKGRVLK
jgi:hypothetical protein